MFLCQLIIVLILIIKKKDYSHFLNFNIVTWSTTEKREIRDFPYPSVFELTGRQRLTVKRGIRNVGQFLAAEVTNPGQNKSQQKEGEPLG